jgi:hypothetical protein
MNDQDIILTVKLPVNGPTKDFFRKTLAEHLAEGRVYLYGPYEDKKTPKQAPKPKKTPPLEPAAGRLHRVTLHFPTHLLSELHAFVGDRGLSDVVRHTMDEFARNKNKAARERLRAAFEAHNGEGVNWETLTVLLPGFLHRRVGMCLPASSDRVGLNASQVLTALMLDAVTRNNSQGGHHD